jgi:cytochrome bd-type quinol oxidase subunit 2
MEFWFNKLMLMKDYILEEFPEGKVSNEKSFVAEVVVFLCILLFAYAAFSKLMDFGNFRLQLGRSPFISAFSPLLVWFIPTVEILSALLMVFRGSRKYGLYIFTFLMASFTIYIAIMLMFSAHTPCICGGIISGMNWFYHMIFNLGFLLLGISGVRNHNKNNHHHH